MDYFLFGGAPSVGKSQSIYRLTQTLLTPARGFVVVSGIFPAIFEDFKVIVEGNNKNGRKIRVLINSATDTVDIIQNLKDFYDQNIPIDIVISSIRDNDFYPRQDFFRIMNINSNSDFVLEVPLSKITRRGTNFFTALTWYENTLDNLVLNSLSGTPFNL